MAEQIYCKCSDPEMCFSLDHCPNVLPAPSAMWIFLPPVISQLYCSGCYKAYQLLIPFWITGRLAVMEAYDQEMELRLRVKKKWVAYSLVSVY